MKKFESQIGVIYYDYDSNNSYYINIYDSNQKLMGSIGGNWESYVEDNSLIDQFVEKAFEEVENACDLAMIGVFEGCYFAESLEDLLEVINDDIEEANEEYECEDPLLTIEDIKDNDYLNIVGDYYIFVYGSGIAQN